ncbi:MAG: hypothetical protein NTW62_03190 [Candidatus Nomurabacteria bacterium]|nr:hypothetical protein [Candidatus Nomurabacteria bacterium]
MHKNYTKILENILKVDQIAIKDFYNQKITQTELSDINNKHLNILKEIIEEIGFPTIKKTSESAYTAAILITLHCGDLYFIQKALNLLEKFKKNEINLSHKAYLIDKFRVLKNLPQIYGTQYKKDSKGNIEFLPILNIENVNKLRKEVGLGSLKFIL